MNICFTLRKIMSNMDIFIKMKEAFFFSSCFTKNNQLFRYTFFV